MQKLRNCVRDDVCEHRGREAALPRAHGGEAEDALMEAEDAQVDLLHGEGEPAKLTGGVWEGLARTSRANAPGEHSAKLRPGHSPSSAVSASQSEHSKLNSPSQKFQTGSPG